MVDRITVHRDGRDIYDIVLEASFSRLREEVSSLGVKGRRLCIVTDTNVAPLYLEQVKEQLSAVSDKITAFVFVAGEAQKNLDTVQKLYQHLILHHYDRKDLRICRCHLSARCALYSNTNHIVVPGRQQYWRQNRCGF